MSGSKKRLELRVDVFEKTDQLALPLPSLTPPEFIEAILQEFRELEYLSNSPTDYTLLKADDRLPLAAEEKLNQQVNNGARLVLVEEEVSLPSSTKQPTHPVYLREQVSGKVYKLNWLPAIIGRPDKNQALNDQVAVDLERYKTGLRVSRRHAQITEKDGQYFIHSLSRNPTALKNSAGELVPVTDEKRPLQDGDVIHLERSNIALKFIIRQ
jgi:hypothetical protein